MQNLFIGKGNLGGTPTLKHVDGRNGQFTVASMRVMFGRYGQTEEGDVEQIGGFWREVEIYDNKAIQAARLLRKGARVLVVGEKREFTGKDDAGKPVQVLKVVADDVALQLSRVESVTFAPARGCGDARHEDAAASAEA